MGNCRGRVLPPQTGPGSCIEIDSEKTKYFLIHTHNGDKNSVNIVEPGAGVKEQSSHAFILCLQSSPCEAHTPLLNAAAPSSVHEFSHCVILSDVL